MSLDVLYISPVFLCSHSIDIYTVAIKNIRNMRAFSTNQIADILHFNGNSNNATRQHSKLKYSEFYSKKSLGFRVNAF